MSLKHFIGLLLAAVAPLCSPAAETLSLIAGGKSAYTIVIPDDDPRDRVFDAARSLQKYLGEASGCKLAICKESAASPESPAIHLGKTRGAVAAGIPFDKLHDWVYCKKVVGNNLYLAGYDASANIGGGLEYHDREYLGQLNGLNPQIRDRSYKEWRGTHKAVLSFLEREAGVRFLLPGENGRHVPKFDKLEIPGALDELGGARFQYCYGRNYGDLETTIALNHNDIPFYKNYGGHSFNVAVPQGKYAETHPEYFIMVDGERRPFYGPAGGNHLCISNPEVQELMLKEIERKYADGFRWIQVAQTDGQVPCSCPECLKIGGGSQTELQWIIYRKLAVEMKKRHPDAKLVFLSYALTQNPPKSFTDFPDNVVIEYCIWNQFQQKFDDWKTFDRVPKITYIYFWGSYNAFIFSPCRSIRYIAKNLRIMAKNNVQGIFKCGWGISPGLEGPAYYVFSKLLEDPDQDEQKLADEFYRAAYGSACEPMMKFFRALNNALDTPRGESVLDALETRPRNPDEIHTWTYTPDTIRYMDHMLWMAEQLKDPDPKVRARLKLLRREFDYLMVRSKLYHLANAFRATGAPEILNAVERELKTRDQLVNSWYDRDGKMIQEPGFDWPFFCNESKDIMLYGGREIISPFPTEFLRGVGPLKKALNMTSRPEDFNFLATRIGSGELEKFAGEPNRFWSSFGDASAPTKFNVGRDESNLYFVFECGMEAADAADAVTICVNPDGDRKKYQRFTLFADGKKKQGRKGYRDDPLHPDFEKEDSDWNAAWSFKHTVDRDGKRWRACVTIPFATLGIRPPAPGGFLYMNLLRSGSAGSAPWSRLPEHENFTAPDAYGRLDFK